jgi:hypothetical protein
MLEDARRRASAVPTKSCATRRANHATGGSSLRSKNIPLFSHANQFIPAAVPPGKRGVAHVTNARWDAVDAMATTDERDLLRTAKSCGPGAPVLALSFVGQVLTK